MNDNFGKHVKELFNLCFEASLEEKLIIIEKSNYPKEVKERVTSLINHSHKNDSELTKNISQSIQQHLGFAIIQAGDKVEQFTLIRPIGEGGQGEVWLASRNDGEFNQQVAIKFIKSSYNQKEQFRFQTERELLSSLQHENIAQLIGGGNFSDDRLYMIMEWVDGIPFVDYVIQENLSISQTLKCFQQICQAVRYAHKKGIIHRDIKPSNILVTKEGKVKLLDFGIAKSIDANATETKNAVMMTLAYSSPEQINGQAATTATDIYALGLVLYETLTHRKAQDNTAESHADFIKTISDISPTAPSVAIETIQSKKNFNVNELQGDLDNMVMMALRKEPKRRYESIDALITDISNFLQSRPLIASGDSWHYKTKKLLKRNPLASALGLFALIFMLALPVILYINANKIKIERDFANEQAEIAQKTTEFLTTLLESASPLGAKGAAINLDDVLSQAERKMNLQMEKQPKIKARLLIIMSQIYYHLENIPKAIVYYQQAADLFASVEDYNGQLEAMGQVAIANYWNGDSQVAIKFMSQADEIAKKVTDVKETAWWYAKKSTIEYAMGNVNKALSYSKAALAMLQKENVDDAGVMGRVYNGLSLAIQATDKEKALEYNKKALGYAEILGGKMDPFYQSRLLSYSRFLVQLERFDEAQKTLTEVVNAAEKLYGKSHRLYGKVVYEQAALYQNIGEFDKAEIGFLESKRINQSIKNGNNMPYAYDINQLAGIYEDTGNYNKAEPFYRESIKLRKKLAPNNLMKYTRTQANLARLLAKEGLHDESQRLLSSIIPAYELTSNSNLYNKVTVLANTFKDGKNLQNCSNGIKYLEKIAPLIQQQSSKNWRRLNAELWIGEMLINCKEKIKAKPWLDSALFISKNIYKNGSVGQIFVTNKINELSL